MSTGLNSASGSAPVYQESSLVLRQRSSWEAADAGLLLWRQNFFYFIPFFALPLWIVAFSLRLFSESLQPWSYLILWYLKPLFDRMILHVVAVRFFEPRSGLRRLFKGFIGRLFRGLVGDLLWRRFSPWRAVHIPIRVLEGLKFRAAKHRKQVLAAGGLNFCISITVICFILEAAMFFGELFFTLMVTDMIFPEFALGFYNFFDDYDIYLYVIYCFNFIIAESLYVCMGFGLYINSRVEVEGWDIQLMFANFTQSGRSADRNGGGI
ncbi:MAG: hypothetical protein LBP76_08875 [Treponema sp.]|jgi:hypothetical protein|nr:hypothetical protein [Treponema sp.]